MWSLCSLHWEETVSFGLQFLCSLQGVKRNSLGMLMEVVHNLPVHHTEIYPLGLLSQWKFYRVPEDWRNHQIILMTDLHSPRVLYFSDFVTLIYETLQTEVLPAVHWSCGTSCRNQALLWWQYVVKIAHIPKIMQYFMY